jgi:hypothetical protein
MKETVAICKHLIVLIQEAANFQQKKKTDATLKLQALEMIWSRFRIEDPQIFGAHHTKVCEPGDPEHGICTPLV